MQVYRVHKKGNSKHGAYKGTGLPSIWGSPNCPGADSDGIYNYTPEHHFGFKSKKQFKAWFVPEEREMLKKQDFVLSKFKVKKEKIIEGRKQVAFILKDSQPVFSEFL